MGVVMFRGHRTDDVDDIDPSDDVSAVPPTTDADELAPSEELRDALSPSADGPSGSDEDTVAQLVRLGVPQADAAAAVADGRVTLALVRQMLGEKRPYSAEQVARKAGIPVEVLERVEATTGVGAAHEGRYGASDVTIARYLARFLQFIPEDAAVRSARVRAREVSRIALSDVMLVRDQLVAPLRRSGADDVAVAAAVAEGARALLPVSTKMLVLLYRRALFQLIESELVATAARGGAAGELEIELAVGFVDVVGYTALSARIDPAGLDDVLEVFETRVYGVVGEHPSVTLVKFLGDAAMFVAVDPVELAHVLVTLADPVDGLAESPLRGGMSAGPTLMREGDYYGPAVNLAARLTDRARPWTVLVDDALGERLAATFSERRAPPMRLRGVGVRRPLVLRAREDGAMPDTT